MEKMGWSKGSGLGREEQGIKEHLTVKFKDDNKGNGSVLRTQSNLYVQYTVEPQFTDLMLPKVCSEQYVHQLKHIFP